MSTFLVGGYSRDMGGTAEGVTRLSSRADGSLVVDGLAVEAASASYLLRHGDTLYAACEGTARVEQFDLATGRHRGGDAVGGSYPCHLSLVDGTILASCYGDGSIAVLATDPLRRRASVRAEGSGPRAEQEGAHAHATLAVGGTVLSADLGADRIRVHSLRDGVLTRQRSVEVPAGSGPRDLVRHPSGLLLVLAELSNELLVYSPSLELLASATLPGAVDGDHAAGISLSGDGRFVFVAVRGSNVLASLAFDGQALTAIGAVDSGGDFPRHHIVDGGILHVANQLSSTVASFAIDDGVLRPISEPTAVASPTHLVRT